MIRLRAAVLVGVLVSAGCGSSGPPLHPVTGKVFLANGKPAVHATVVFHPVDPAGADVVRPRGKVGADGSYTLTTHAAGDGAAAGEYRVTVELWLAGAKPDDPPANRLPAKFADPAASRLTARVGDGPTEVKPFELR